MPPRKAKAPPAAPLGVTLKLGSLLQVSSFQIRNRGPAHQPASGAPAPRSSKPDTLCEPTEPVVSLGLLVEGRGFQPPARKDEAGYVRPHDDSEVDQTEAGDLIALAHMLAEEGPDICDDLDIRSEQIEEQEAALQSTCRRQREHDSPSKATRSGFSDSPSSAAEASGPAADFLSPLERLRSAAALSLATDDDVEAGFGAVAAVVESDLIVGDLDLSASDRLVDVNSGGDLYFVFCSSGISTAERAVVVKFGPSRMATQGEALAYEIASVMGAPSARARLLHGGSRGWESLLAGAQALAPSPDAESDDGEDEGKTSEPTEQDEGEGKDDPASAPPASRLSSAERLARTMGRSRVALLVELVNGPPLAQSPDAFGGPAVSEATAESLGRLAALDLVLANPDRLPCRELGWRGNPNNVRWGVSFRAVKGIDHTLARKPPRMMLCTPSAAAGVAASVLGLPLPPEGPKPDRRRMAQPLVPSGPELVATWLEAAGGGQVDGPAFVRGFRAALVAGVPLLSTLSGLLSELDDELASFFETIRRETKAGGGKDPLGSTRDLKQLQDRSARDANLRAAFSSAEARLLAGAGADRGATEDRPGDRSFLAAKDMRAVSAHELRTRLRHVTPRLEAILTAAHLRE